jgi:hypothetical protein
LNLVIPFILIAFEAIRFYVPFLHRPFVFLPPVFHPFFYSFLIKNYYLKISKVIGQQMIVIFGFINFEVLGAIAGT